MHFGRYGEMVMYKVVFTKQSMKDLENLRRAGLSQKAKTLVDIIRENPFQNPPGYEKMVGNLEGIISRELAFNTGLYS